jgi:hypothetical protein
VPGLSVVMTSPEVVRVAPFSAAALSRYACPAFFSTDAAAPARAVCSAVIFGPYVCTSTLYSFLSTPSLMPARTASSSVAFRLKLVRFWLITSPRA